MNNIKSATQHMEAANSLLKDELPKDQTQWNANRLHLALTGLEQALKALAGIIPDPSIDPNYDNCLICDRVYPILEMRDYGDPEDLTKSALICQKCAKEKT